MSKLSCPKCGKRVPKKLKQCPHCEHFILNRYVVPIGGVYKKKRRKWPVVAIACFVLAIGAGLAWMWLH